MFISSFSRCWNVDHGQRRSLLNKTCLYHRFPGVGTSAIYCDQELRSKGFPFECYPHKSRTIVVKTHEPEKGPDKITVKRRNAPALLPYKRVILIIRNPYDFLVANIYSSHLDTVTENSYFSNSSKLLKENIN